MTNEEAKEFLLDLRAGCVSSYGTALYEESMAFVEALDLAISALERDRWHGAEEPIPNEENIIGWYGGGEYDQLRWYDLVDGTVYEGERLIAWYKLPEPPKEET
jgi:hypothetical protein